MNRVNIVIGNGNKTIVAFTGRNNTPFLELEKVEWSNILKDHYKTLISFNDPSCRWYVDSHWPDIIKDTLKDFSDVDLGVGVSMGGWAALFYSNLLKTNRIRVFGPQSFVDPVIWNTLGPMHQQWVTPFGNEKYEVPVCPADIDIKIGAGSFIEDEIHYKKFIEKKYMLTYVKTKSHNVINRFRRTDTLLDFLFNNYE